MNFLKIFQIWYLFIGKIFSVFGIPSQKIPCTLNKKSAKKKKSLILMVTLINIYGQILFQSQSCEFWVGLDIKKSFCVIWPTEWIWLIFLKNLNREKLNWNMMILEIHANCNHTYAWQVGVRIFYWISKI